MSSDKGKRKSTAITPYPAVMAVYLNIKKLLKFYRRFQPQQPLPKKIFCTVIKEHAQLFQFWILTRVVSFERPSHDDQEMYRNYTLEFIISRDIDLYCSE